MRACEPVGDALRFPDSVHSRGRLPEWSADGLPTRPQWQVNALLAVLALSVQV
ncbi:hypothetical protein ACVW19_000575 [Streptomyces sp. TE5632]